MKTLKQNWGGSQVTRTCKTVSSKKVIEHIGDRERHLQDQLAIQRVHQMRILKDLGIALPNLSHVPLESSLGNIGFKTGAEAESIAATLTTRGILITGIFTRQDQNCESVRKFAVVSGDDFVAHAEGERTARACYRDKNYTHHKRPDLALETQYCRVPPWIGKVAKGILACDPELAAELMKELCRRFSTRYTVDVVGIALHTENENDFHVHILFSRSLEKIKQKGAGRSGRQEAKHLHALLRTELKEAGKAATPKAVSTALSEAIKEGRFPDPKQSLRSLEYVRREHGSGQAIRSWGPTYRNKYWVYRAARGEQRDHVAAKQDRGIADPGGFRYWIADLASVTSSPTDHFSDVWAERQWQKLCMRVMTHRHLRQVSDLRRAAVANYLEVGTTMPTPMEALAAHYRGEKLRNDSLTEKLNKSESDLQKHLRDNEELTQRVLAAENQAKEAIAERNIFEEQNRELMSEVAQALAKVPVDLRGQSINQSVDRLVSEVSQLRTMLKKIATAFQRLAEIPKLLIPAWDLVRHLCEPLKNKITAPKEGIDLEDI